MTPAQFNQYLSAVRQHKNNYPSLRMGQCYFNVLRDEMMLITPEFYGIKGWVNTRITGTIYDPFYDDNNIGAFLERVYTELVDK